MNRNKTGSIYCDATSFMLEIPVEGINKNGINDVIAMWTASVNHHKAIQIVIPNITII